MHHTLKTDKPYFHEVLIGTKTFEIRKDDRDFQPGDELLLRETLYTGAEMAQGLPLHYTGLELSADVVGVTRGPIYGLADGWVILSIIPRES